MWKGVRLALDRLTWREPPLGLRGERAAERYLRRLGHVVVARGLRNTYSEIDLVTVDGETVVFVEVKTRQTHGAGHPGEAITPAKERRLTRAALSFLRRHGLLEQPARFDVVAVTWPAGDRRPTIQHVANAFQAVGQWQFFA